MQQMEIWLAILFLSRKKFRAKQIFVLSSSIKLGPGNIGLVRQREFFYPTVNPWNFHTVYLFQWVPVAHFKNTQEFYHLPLLRSSGSYSPGMPLCRGRIGGRPRVKWSMWKGQPLWFLGVVWKGLQTTWHSPTPVSDRRSRVVSKTNSELLN